MSRESRDRHVWGETWSLYVVPLTAEIKTGDMVRDDDAGAGLEIMYDTVNTYFVGMAMQDSPSTKLDAIRVATEGVFELDCAAGSSFALGAWVTYSADQTVEAGNAGNGIGRVWKKVTSVSRVPVKIDTRLRFGLPT